tara:strand:+ start:65 stop:442 length:378 start_codon:yes stop_codon:yes gene_type:complete
MKSKGLGDTIEKITKATGIKAGVDYVFDKMGIDCGCEKRKKRLNSLFPYKKPECLNAEEYETLKDIFKHINNRLGATEQQKLLKIHNRIFNQQRKMSSCGSCVKELVDTMRKLFNEYEYEQETQT